MLIFNPMLKADIQVPDTQEIDTMCAQLPHLYANHAASISNE